MCGCAVVFVVGRLKLGMVPRWGRVIAKMRRGRETGALEHAGPLRLLVGNALGVLQIHALERLGLRLKRWIESESEEAVWPRALQVCLGTQLLRYHRNQIGVAFTLAFQTRPNLHFPFLSTTHNFAPTWFASKIAIL